MSTKTIYKRIALIAVATLGAGVLSVAPASADGVTAQALVTSIGLANTTATPTVGAAVVINLGGVTTTAAGETDADTLAFRGYLSTYPSNGYVQTTANATAVGTDGEFFKAGLSAEAAAGNTYTTTITTAALNLGTTTVASATVGVAKFSFTPTVAGVHVLSVWADSDGDGVADLGEAAQTISITVVAASTFSTGTSSAYLVDGNTIAVGTVTTDALGASGSKTISIANVGAITVSLKDATNTAMASGNTITATISGVGSVGATAVDTPVVDQCSATKSSSDMVKKQELVMPQELGLNIIAG